MAQLPTPPGYLTIGDVARRIRVRPQQCRRLLREGLIRTETLPRKNGRGPCVVRQHVFDAWYLATVCDVLTDELWMKQAREDGDAA